ncbi:MAG: ATP-binding protein [Tannerellaceae bacterium]|nr:ATP-binding protein [Tannerellaceae bacterium]
MEEWISLFEQQLYFLFNRFLGREEEVSTPLFSGLPENRTYELPFLPEKELTWEEWTVCMLALLPHLHPQTLDLFFLKNREMDRPYTQFGGWQGHSHSGFLPTGETAAFLISVQQPEKRKEVYRLFSKEHWFYKEHILWLEGQERNEPLLSGRLVLSEEIIAGITQGTYQPEYGTDFPATRVTTPLEWKDLVLPYYLQEELEDILLWQKEQQEIRKRWQLDRFIKPGYRCLFYGPPGTGKTLTALLLGKQNGMEVYRVDLSMIISKYIGETEKNLARIFDKAAFHQWILFFDEADALFGQRTESRSANDRYANQEVAYLLQRIEDFPGMVILASNLKENMDEAFFRRFQSVLYFPLPDKDLRYRLWKQMLPVEWKVPEELLEKITAYKIAGGSMVNVIQGCAVRLFPMKDPVLTEEILLEMILKEQKKEGRLIAVSD